MPPKNKVRPVTTPAMVSKFRDFCEHTSMHGWNFCSRGDRSLAHNRGWLCVVMISTTLVCSYVWQSAGEFAASTVSFTQQSVIAPLDEVYFPSIVLCNTNSLRSSFIHELLQDPMLQNVSSEELRQTLESHLGSDDSKLPEDTEDTEDISRVLKSFTYESMFAEHFVTSRKNWTLLGDYGVTKWHVNAEVATADEKLKRSSIVELAAQFRDGEMVTRVSFSGGWGVFYQPGFATDISQACVWLTVYVKEPKDPKTLRTEVKSVLNGVNNGLELLLDAESFDYSTSQLANEGFAVSILHQLDIPIMKQNAIEIATGRFVKIGIDAEIIDIAEGCKNRFSPVERQCYFEDEIQLQHFPYNDSYRYELSNCLYEASLQTVEKECNCTQAMYLDIVDEYPACEGAEEVKCMDNIVDSIGTIRTINDRGETKECLSACEDQKHSFLVSQSKFPNLQSFHRTSEFCIVLDKLKKSCSGGRRESLSVQQPLLCPAIDKTSSLTCEDIKEGMGSTSTLQLRSEVAEYARHNMAKLVVYFRDSSATRYLTEEAVTEATFVGAVGGILGLFTGFSFVSAAEVIYYVILALLSGRN